MLRFIYGGYVTLFLFILSFSTFASGANKMDGSSSVIQVRDNLLTVKVSDMPLEKVLDKIANQIPIKFAFFVSGEEPLKADFTSLPLEEGLKRLFRDYNYAIINGDSEKSKGREHEIEKVIILSKAKGSQSRRAEPIIVYTEEPSALESLNEGQSPEDLDKLEEIENKVVVDSLREVLQDQDADLRLMIVEEIATIGGVNAIQALEDALEDEDEDVRKMAAEKLRQLE